MRASRKEQFLFGACAFLLTMPIQSDGAGVIGLNVPGISGPLGSVAALPPPADIAAAAGLSDLAEFVDGAFAVFNKTNGSPGPSVSDSQFWLNAGMSASTLSAGISNPRLLFDPTSDRWVATEITNDSTNNTILLAVSNSADPNPSAGNWQAVTLAANSAQQPGYASFPTLGMDANAVYIGTTNLTPPSFADPQESLFSIPKADLIAPAGPSLANATVLYGTGGNSDSLGFVLQPAVNLASVSSSEAILSIDYNSFGELHREDLTGTTGPGATLSAPQTITVANTQFPTLPRQPDGSGNDPNTGLESLDDRIASSVYQVGNLVYLINTIGLPTYTPDTPFPSQSAIQWTVLQLKANSTSVVQQGTIEDPNYDFFDPSICANAQGAVVIGYDRSGPSNPSGDVNAYFSVGTTNGMGQITFGSPQQASFSTIDDYGLTMASGNPDDQIVPWGEYSSVTADPSDANIFWSVQEVPTTSTSWGTQITEIIVPEPATLTIIAMCGSCVLIQRSRCRRWSSF